jgi:hypothetical protein
LDFGTLDFWLWTLDFGPCISDFVILDVGVLIFDFRLLNFWNVWIFENF